MANRLAPHGSILGRWLLAGVIFGSMVGAATMFGFGSDWTLAAFGSTATVGLCLVLGGLHRTISRQSAIAD